MTTAIQNRCRHKAEDNLACGVETRAARRLAEHPHFLGRSHHVRCQSQGRRLQLSGCLPSYFLKQLAQEALRDLQGVDQIDNRIVEKAEIARPIRRSVKSLVEILDEDIDQVAVVDVFAGTFNVVLQRPRGYRLGPTSDVE